MDTLKKRVLAAKREIPSDLVLKGGNVVNVFSARIEKADVAICDGIIAGIGPAYHGKEEVDVQGKWITPGLIDGHIHVESSMLVPSELARALLIHGTTTIVSDPHEIANVHGIDGIRFMIENSESIPFDIYFMAPSCVPATHLETSGADLKASDLAGLKDEPRILGLAEVMNFPGVISGDDQILEKIRIFADRVIDGHSPLLSGYDLQAYLSAGIGSDHESMKLAEALEKMEGGMMVMIREGTSAKNLKDLLPLVNERNQSRFCFVSDDLHAEDIHSRGHLDFVLRKSVQLGLDPVTALRLATINPANYFRLYKKGALAPGWQADIVVLNDLTAFEVDTVYKNGKPVVQRGELIDFPSGVPTYPNHLSRSMNMAEVTPESFAIAHPGGMARVINLIPDQIVTVMSHESVQAEKGWFQTDTVSDILKMAVVERHKGTGNIGHGLVRGFGLKMGAIASSVAHDSHNIIVVGVDDVAICGAVQAVSDMGGGIAVFSENRLLASVPLEIAGLMSVKPLQTVVGQLEKAKVMARELGCGIHDPFMALSFLALPVIPELKLTDRGLVDVNRFEIVPLFMEQRIQKTVVRSQKKSEVAPLR